MNINRRAAGTVLAALAATVALAGCSAGTSTDSDASHTHSDASRVRFYSSIQDLASDSAAVVSGTVSAQRSATDIDPTTVFTISTVTIKTAVKGAGLAAGSTVEVRQFGDSTHAGPAPLLTKGSDYLLYLTRSGLSGPLASQYYVTGGTAGIYQTATTTSQARSAGGSFSQVQPDEGDKLPTKVSLGDAQG